jgi:hypothetical protein
MSVMSVDIQLWKDARADVRFESIRYGRSRVLEREFVMPCLVGCFALLFPRVAIIGVVIFSDYIGNAYQTVLWPLLGFFVMPLTTLAYAYAINSTGQVSGLGLVLVVLAVLVDLGIIGGNASNRQVRTYVGKRGS